MSVTGTGAPLPFELRKVSRDDCRQRESVVRRFPGGIDGVALNGLAAVLRLQSVRLEIHGITSSPTALPSDCVPIALTARGGRKKSRFVLGLSAPLSDRLVNLTLGRPSRPAIAGLSHEERLLSGEKGALLFGLDAAGGDWLAAGGGKFIVKAVLFDGDQIPDYLGCRPNYEVVGRLSGPGIDGALWFWGGEPLTVPEESVQRVSSRVRSWRSDFHVCVGWSSVPSKALADLEVGDRILLDGWCSPLATGGDPPAGIRSGKWRRFIRWVDNRHFEVIHREERISDMAQENESSQIPVVLTNTEGADEGDISVTVSVEVGSFQTSIAQASKLVPGRVVSLDRGVGAEVSLKVDGKLIGRGELVDHEGIMAVEVKDLMV